MKIIAASDLRRGYGDNSHINFVIGRAGMMANINNCDRKYSGLITPPRFKRQGAILPDRWPTSEEYTGYFGNRGGLKGE